MIPRLRLHYDYYSVVVCAAALSMFTDQLASCHPERSGRSPPQQAKSGPALRDGDPGSGPRSEGSLWGPKLHGHHRDASLRAPQSGRAPFSMTDALGLHDSISSHVRTSGLRKGAPAPDAPYRLFRGRPPRSAGPIFVAGAPALFPPMDLWLCWQSGNPKRRSKAVRKHNPDHARVWRIELPEWREIFVFP